MTDGGQNPTYAEMAHLLLTDQHRLRVAYEHYIAHAPWVSFEVFELGVQILSEDESAARPS